MKNYLDAAIDAARIAGRIQMEGLGRKHEISLKEAAELVTEVDLRCEKAVMESIRDQYPDHTFLAEEGGEKNPGSDHIWFIDPLDGTTNYAHGYPRFCVSIALSIKGSVVAGVVYSAVNDEMFTAIRGEGAFLNGEAVRVSETGEVENSLICTGFSYDKQKRMEDELGAFTRVLPLARAIRRDGCAALDLCYVACGRYDGYWELSLNPWDVAAGILLIEEAGGKVTDLKGEKPDLGGKKFLGTNKFIHARMLELLSRKDEQ
ncbi:MAG: inositol monophosphatase family protein [bacterium]